MALERMGNGYGEGVGMVERQAEIAGGGRGSGGVAEGGSEKKKAKGDGFIVN